ncbi:hypothetical protein KI688_001755 [Linnemannia hyalina]|uniref:Uncharacterized protein n=1 Tax=Linnemannia hyalina TaxID=64524 RepID=A0A9P8BU08_9FUNG|nr:hypothetical protein KI688_001755 [Linnemannia hyalina]
MFKATVPSVAPSASASASSHDTHSLPPAFKGPVQRFLAVSLPTVTLTPEFIDILDSVDTIIPSRVQVTIRWWNEDTASSLAVFPRLNSPLPPSVEVHQALLRKQQLDKKTPHQPLQPEPQQQDQQEQPLSSIASNSALPPLTTAPQPRSMTAKFLRRPWTTGGARLMNALRIGNNKKSKEDNPSSSKTPLATQDIDAHKGNQQPQDHAVDDTLPPMNRRRQDVQPVSNLIPTLQPTTPNPPPPAAAALADAKPLPTLPDAAYPVTVAYPVRCSLDQLYRYFLEMTSLALEIQITPNLTILASVTNLADLFRNIHGTFSGVFPFTTVLQNNDPKLAHHDIFNRRAVLGMAVFQAWCQDTSDVGDTSEGSDSTSNASIHNDERSTALHHHHHHHHRSHNGQGSIRHHRQPSYQHSGHPTEHSSISYHHPPPQHPLHQQQQMHRVRPSLGVPSKQPPPVHPLSPSAVVDPTVHHQQQQKVPQLQRGARIIDRRPLVGPRHPDSHLHYQSSLRFDDEPATYRHRRLPSHPHPNAIGPSQMPYENQNLRGSRGGGDGRQQGMAGAAGVGSIDSSSHQYPNIKLPIPDLRPPYDASYRRHARNGVQRPSQDDSLYRHRRSEDTNTTTHHSQGSRSRPRSGATAAAIGRLDSVLARGEDLLQGMKTSLALDPEEVRTRSARHLRSSVLKDDHQDDSRFRPYHESLPYWPSKSRFKLELSIPTAYLTSHGLLIRQSGRGSRGQEFWTSMMGGAGHRREDSLGEGSESTPRGLRRSEKPIQFEKVARKSDLARLQLAQEQSAATAHGHYQSFQTSPDSSSRQYRQENHRQHRQGTMRRRSSSGSRRKDGPSSSSLPGHQPRKSKSYPPETFPTMGADPGRPWKQHHRRRLSSNDRLQIRMNPRPGDLLNDTPDLFPSRSMSGLVRPEYHSSVTGSSFSGAEDNYSTGQSYSVSTEDEDLRHGGAMGGRQSRLQRRRKVPSVEEEEDVDEEVERVNQQRRRRERSLDRRKESRRRQRRNKDQGRGFGQEQGPGKRQHGVHPQHFNFKAQCQLMLTPEVMAACMLENISVEVWKLNPKRQTMIELGSAKLPLHKVLSRILQKTAAASASGAGPHGSTRGNLWGGPGGPQDSYYGSGSAARMREWQQQQWGGGGGARAAGTFKEGWRLEPSLYDIRSRQGTVIGQLDADVWILPRSRSDSMVSAAA